MDNQKFYLFAIILFFSWGYAISQDLNIYVSPDGADTNSGSIEAPLKSLDAARDKIRNLKNQQPITETIRVIIRPGMYPLSSTLLFGPEDSGSENAPIIYQAEDGVIFSGGMEIVGFKKASNGLWVTHIPEVSFWNWSFDQFYVNDQRATKARTPNDGYFHMKDVAEEVWIQGAGRAPEKAQQIVVVDEEVSSKLGELSVTELDDVVLTAFHHWNITKRHIDKFDGSESKIYTSGHGMKPWNPWKPGKRFILEGYQGALDEPGEWYLNPEGKLFYMPRPGEEIETSNFYAPVIEQFIKIEGNPAENRFVEYIIFENLHFQHAADYLPRSGFEPYQAAISIDAAIELNGAKHIQFNNCEVEHTGGYGLWLNQAVSHCQINHCHIHDLGAGGIRIGELTIRNEEYLQTHSNIIKNNIIQSGGYDFAPGVGVLIGQSADNKVLHNDIGDFRYTGVSVGWRWGYDFSPSKRNKIKHNHIHHIGWGVLSDMAGVYTLGPSEGTEVSNNYIHHIYAYDYGGWGLYTDEGSSNILMENNLVHHTKTGGFHQHYGRENIIRNNIIAFSEKYQIQATRVEDHLSFSFLNNIVLYNKGVLYQGPWKKMNVKIDNNLYWNKSGNVDFQGEQLRKWQKHGYDKKSIISDPLFKDPVNGDYTFASKKKYKKIKFKPFDYKKCGVFGNEEWKNKAKLSKKVLDQFSRLYKQ